jgi:glycolate oxidase iron-sulfur subunit
MDSPRGRIHALRAIEAGELELDATVASHFDTCLGCYACVTACPSGVRYDQLIEATRPKLNNAKLRSSWQISFRQLLLQGVALPTAASGPAPAAAALRRHPYSGPSPEAVA